MEEGFGVVEIEQSHAVFGCRTADIGHNCNHWSDPFPVFVVGIPVGSAPSTALFAGTWIEVEIENAQMAVILVEYFIGNAFGVIHRNGYWTEGDSPQPVAELEYAL